MTIHAHRTTVMEILPSIRISVFGGTIWLTLSWLNGAVFISWRIRK